MPFDFFLFLFIFFKVTKSSFKEASVYYDRDLEEYKLVEGVIDPEAAAYGFVEVALEEKGYDKFVVHTNGDFEDDIQSFSAGYIEGALNPDRIISLKNFLLLLYGGTIPEEVKNFIKQNLEWVNEQISQNPNDNYWLFVKTLYSQIEGIVRGFNEKNDQGIEYDLMEYLSYMDSDAFFFFHSKSRDACSALIKLTKNNENIFFGHDLWFIYGVIVTMYKEYHFSYKNDGVKAQSIYQTGWAGLIDSCQHFMITSAGIAITETSLDILNNTIAWEEGVSPNKLFTTFRVVVAARFANSAEKFVDVFKDYNPGLFNSNWMILDMNLFQSGEPIKEKTLYMIEQMPGILLSVDMSEKFEKEKYLASYNAAYFPEIAEKAGYNEHWKSKNPETAMDFSYNHSARANIFRRDHSKVTDIESFKKLMRYDDWKNDEFSGNYSHRVICSRGEWGLNSPCVGCLDSKGISVNAWKESKEIHFIVSPPYDNNPVFNFETSVCKNTKPYKAPDVWGFEWTNFNANYDISPSCDPECVNGHCVISDYELNESECLCEKGYEKDTRNPNTCILKQSLPTSVIIALIVVGIFFAFLILFFLVFLVFVFVCVYFKKKSMNSDSYKKIVTEGDSNSIKVV